MSNPRERSLLEASVLENIFLSLIKELNVSHLCKMYNSNNYFKECQNNRDIIITPLSIESGGRSKISHTLGKM